MTDLDVRPEQLPAMELPASPEPPRPMRARSLRAAVLIAAGVAIAGLVIVAALVLIAWGAEKRSSASAATAVRAAGQAWLFAHHSPLGTGGGTIGLVPIGLTALPVSLLIWAGLQVGRELAPCSVLDAARAALAMAATYGIVAFAVHLLCGIGGIRMGPLVAVLPAIGLAFAGAGAGIACGSGVIRSLRPGLPAWLPVSLRAALLALCIPLATGAVMVAGALAADGGRVVSLTDNLAVGAVGGALLLVLSILLAPNAIVCAAAMATGPGFAVGTGTSVTVHGSSLGPVPAYPLLAALPEGPAPSPLCWAVVAAPVLGGIVAGAVLDRVVQPRSWRSVLLTGGVTGAAAGGMLAVLAAAAGGPLGSGRLAAVGPSPWKVGVAFTLEVALLAIAMSGCCGWRRIREAGVERELAQLRPIAPESLEVPPLTVTEESDTVDTVAAEDTEADAGADTSQVDADAEVDGSDDDVTDAEADATDAEADATDAEAEADSDSDDTDG